MRRVLEADFLPSLLFLDYRHNAVWIYLVYSTEFGLLGAERLLSEFSKFRSNSVEILFDVRHMAVKIYFKI